MCYLRGLIQPLLSSKYGMDDETVLLCYLVTTGELLCYGLIFPRQHFVFCTVSTDLTFFDAIQRLGSLQINKCRC